MDGGNLMMLLAALLSVAALVGLVVGLGTLRVRTDPVLRRLKQYPVLHVVGPAETAEPEKAQGVVGRGLEAVARVVRGGDADFSQLRRRLVQAGLRRESAVHLFLVSKVVLALALPLAFLAYDASRAEPVRMAVPIAVWLCAGGFFLPNVWIASRRRSRQQLIDRGLPDALDLLVTCVEAGLGLDAALLRVAGDLSLSWPVLAEELNLTFLEIKAGIMRADAFRRLYERTGADELKSLAATLAQAEMFGTSIALSLRVQASGMRVRRAHRAEERAASVAVKMTVPLVLCILPSLMAIIMGPAAVSIYNALFRQMGK